MTTLLLPFDGSAGARSGLRHVAAAHRRDPGLVVHVLNVQPPLSRNVAHHVGRATCRAFHEEQAATVLAAAQQALDTAGVRCSLHWEVGDRAQCIVDAARRWRCDRIVIGTTRKSLLVRLVEGSVINRVIAHTTVPVEVIAGDAPSRLERIGIPAGVGTGLTALWFAAAE